MFSCEQVASVEQGVTRTLAVERSDRFSSVHYDLTFHLPGDRSEPVVGTLLLSFKTIAADQDLVLDYTPSESTVQSVWVNEEKVSAILSQGHLIVPARFIEKGYNEVRVSFQSMCDALHRSEDYMYSLFVPNKASEVYPCFDQPDIKATYSLTLNVPSMWECMSNAAVAKVALEGERKSVMFEKTELISSYLFAFTAGIFEKRSFTGEVFDFEMIYRVHDEERLEENLEEIYNLHMRSVAWMEEYTGIAFPFDKFGVAVLPSFPFGGMEHPGVIDYRASLLMLDETATLEDQLKRAGLIAHETAHMWFGNYVTMTWFDDVWMKEVFANFMADKIVAELYPEVNHELAFLYDHYPSAYEVDRTQGTVPIRQELVNLDEAANMYGNIIYHKAPIMMRQLEILLGEKVLQSSLKDYLDSHAYGHADWEDLVTIMQRVSGRDLSVFNKSWIYQEGMPFFELTFQDTDVLYEYDIIQHDPKGKGRVWPQYTDIRFEDDLGYFNNSLYLDDHHYILPSRRGADVSNFVAMNTHGQGYGVFSYGLGYVKEEFLFEQARVDISRYEDDLIRGATYLNLHEYLLQEGFHPQMYFFFLQNYLREEKNEQIVEYLLSLTKQVYFRFFDQRMRSENAENIENLLLNKIEEVESQSLKTSLFNAYVELSVSPEAIRRLKYFWEGDSLPSGVTVSQRQEENLALHIALKGSVEDEDYLTWQMEKMDDDDRVRRLQFIAPATSHDAAMRDEFFELLRRPENRTHESWVLTALSYLHHPVRGEASIDYLKPSLDMIPELQRTGDIFFVKGWLDHTLYGFNSTASADVVRQCLNQNNTSIHLQNKLLQASDLLFRAEANLIDYQAD
ncbi:hypothetical protein BFP72_06945 [Reichenbachiella sp. 5M10]|nr:hypothetical protein BFP72_06945 [Reichenbachiella sp. 5M10]